MKIPQPVNSEIEKPVILEVDGGARGTPKKCKLLQKNLAVPNLLGEKVICFREGDIPRQRKKQEKRGFMGERVKTKLQNPG